MIRVKHCFKTVTSFQKCNDQCHVEYYVKINECRHLAVDGLEDTDVDYTSNNDAGSSPTYYQLFSSVFYFFSYLLNFKL